MLIDNDVVGVMKKGKVDGMMGDEEGIEESVGYIEDIFVRKIEKTLSSLHNGEEIGGLVIVKTNNSLQKQKVRRSKVGYRSEIPMTKTTQNFIQENLIKDLLTTRWRKIEVIY
jgi:hypothetical protein